MERTATAPVDVRVSDPVGAEVVFWGGGDVAGGSMSISVVAIVDEGWMLANRVADGGEVELDV